ncbi:hypothetical protein P0M11_08780 [Kaistella sp. PBT33-4]|uniref:hypothetical protein n=1 Tax=Kaistella sp. PBT33-4 TaxID=3032000 RepID=UPI0023D85B3E|nr:hypothetical protein [Kaistella sp. PBT33-4]MDF0720092.1 hypothetical protein [Kaistella sp. PBT33-4]
MKKIFFLSLILIAALSFFYFKDAILLVKEENYAIVNETNRKIPATFYSKNVVVDVGGKAESVYEILIFFDEEQELNPIVIIPKYKLIGLVEGGRRGFIKFGSNVLQLSDDSNKFNMLNDTAFFDDPPIKQMRFDHDYIVFNTFKGLKKYGATIILRKQ